MYNASIKGEGGAEMNVDRIKDAIHILIDVVGEEIPDLEVVNCKELIVAFKEDVPPLVSAKGITLHLPDIIGKWEESERLVTWGELFGMDGILEEEAGASDQLKSAIVNLVKSKVFHDFVGAVEDHTCDGLMRAYKSVYGDEPGGGEEK